MDRLAMVVRWRLHGAVRTTTTTSSTATRSLSTSSSVAERAEEPNTSSGSRGTRSGLGIRRSSSTAVRNGDENKATVKLWSVLEDAEGVRPSVVATKEAGERISQPELDQREKTSSLLDAIQTASSIQVLDKRWRSITANETLDPQERTNALLTRSLTLSKLSRSSSTELNRVLGAMNRVLRNPSLSQGVGKDDYLSIVNNAAKAFVRAENGTKALEMMQDLRKEQGKLFPNRTSYAVAIAAVLLPTSVGPTVKKTPEQQLQKLSNGGASERLLHKSTESALRTALVYFKSLFNTDVEPTIQLEEEKRQAPVVIAEPQLVTQEAEGEEPATKKPTVFSVLAMLKEDYLAGNPDAKLSEALFDDVLVLLPKMSAEVAEAMARSGLEPTSTSFLAMLHSAMRAADAQKALQLLGMMMEQNIPRDRVHYIAVASALSSRAAADRKRSGAVSAIKPWYFKAILDGYAKDFGAAEMDVDLVGIVLKGLCMTKSGDQDVVPMLESLVKDLSKQHLPVGPDVFALMIERLSVTNGKENVSRIVDWMKSVSEETERTRSVNEAFLTFYAEQLVKLQRSATRLLAQQKDRPDSLALAESKIVESRATVAAAERLVLEMVPSRGSVAQLLQNSIASNSLPSPSVVLDVTTALPRSDKTGEEQAMFLDADARAWNILAKVYTYSLSSSSLSQLIDALSADVKAKIIASSPKEWGEMRKQLMHALIKTYGLEKQVDAAVEIVARMQSEGLALDQDTVDLLAVDVCARNDRLGEGLAHLLGLCRTYKIKPKGSTGIRLLEKARKEGKELEEQVLAMFDEFGLQNELKRVSNKSTTR